MRLPHTVSSLAHGERTPTILLMAAGRSKPASVPSLALSGREFRTTHWSVVLAASDPASPHAAEALETLCRAYWYPLYAYVRRSDPTRSPEDAQDLTQQFFARFLEKDYLGQVDRRKGRF